MKVVYFHRKPRDHGNYSVEILFKEIRARLPPHVKAEVHEAPFLSNGLIKRFWIAVEAAFHQGEINHITGDINFVAAFLKGKKTVLTILDLGLMATAGRISRFIYKLFWIGMPARRCAAITTISQATKTELLKFAKIDPSKVHVVYVPISSSFVSAPRPFNKQCPLILQVGTLPNKNVHRVVAALKGIKCRLEIIGKVDDELKHLLSENSIDYHASRNLSQQEVVEKYVSCDVLSFPSTYEGFGMPIVEANAVGRVVVTSNLLSMPEVGGNAAHYVDPFDIASIRDGFLKVIEDDDYRATLIQNGFQNCQRFSVGTIVRQYVDIYTQLHNS